jgi:hypothetical protein
VVPAEYVSRVTLREMWQKLRKMSSCWHYDRFMSMPLQRCFFLSCARRKVWDRNTSSQMSHSLTDFTRMGQGFIKILETWQFGLSFNIIKQVLRFFFENFKSLKRRGWKYQKLSMLYIEFSYFNQKIVIYLQEYYEHYLD